MTGIETGLAEEVEALAADCAAAMEVCEKAIGDAGRRRSGMAKTGQEIALQRVSVLLHVMAGAADVAMDILRRDV